MTAGAVALACVAAVGVLGYRAVATAAALGPSANGAGSASLIFDSQGQLVSTTPGADYQLKVTSAQIPPLVQDAFVATEDRTFFTNIGISFRGIARAALIDITGRGFQGGSTITQQLARTLYLNRNISLWRKLREAFLAMELTQRYSKAQILDMYLNTVFLGSHAIGLQAAAITYFDQPHLNRLTLPQVALLAGLPQAPSADDPLVHPAAARTRRNEVLAGMAEQHYISAAQARAAEGAALELHPGQPSQNGASGYHDPWFVDAVIQTLEQPPYNLPPQTILDGGLRIYTTLNQKVQNAADAAVQARARQTRNRFPGIQVGEAVVNQQTGAVVALVGGWQHTVALGLNRATDIRRQPGSSIKPFVDYIPALEHGMTAGTVVDDRVHTYPGANGQLYAPTDDNPPYYGLTTITEALRRSVNTIALQVLQHVGVRVGVANAIRMGLPLSPSDDNLAVAIGGIRDTTCCSPLNMASAYAAIANGGYRVTPYLVTRVVAPNGQVLATGGPHRKRVVSAQIAYVMTQILSTVTNPQPAAGWDANWSTGYDGAVHDNVPGWPTAGKSGTTNQDKDAWFVEYTPQYTAAVWLGQDMPRANTALYGGTYAGPIAQATLAGAEAGVKPMPFARPAGVLQAQVDAKAAPFTVAQPSARTPARWVQTDWFVQGTQPTKPSTLWRRLLVTAGGGGTRLWTLGCPLPAKAEVFLARSHLGQAWAQNLAGLVGLPWQQLIPVDAQLAPPTARCGSGRLPASDFANGGLVSTPSASAGGAVSSSSTAPASATSSAAVSGTSDRSAAVTGAPSSATGPVGVTPAIAAPGSSDGGPA